MIALLPEVDTELSTTVSNAAASISAAVRGYFPFRTAKLSVAWTTFPAIIVRTDFKVWICSTGTFR